MCNLYREPSTSINASYQVSVHLAKRFQKRFLEIGQPQTKLPVTAIFVIKLIRNVQSLERTFHKCFLTSFGSFGQAVSEEKIFKNRPIKNRNCLSRPWLFTDQDEMCNLYRGPSTDTSKFQFIWLSGFRGED